MAKTGMTFETKDFDIKLPRVINKEIPEAAASTFPRVAGMVLRDAILEEPKAPHKTGHMKRNQKIEYPKIEKGEISIELGFNTDYAMIVHEMPSNVNWSMAGSGPKFLEAKLLRNKEKYIAELARGMQGRK